MIRFLILLSLVLLPRYAGAWGAGHDDVARAVMARLPKEIVVKFTPEIVKEAVQEDSH